MATPAEPRSAVPAARRLGLFTRQDARATGLSAKQVRLRLNRGDWQVVLGPVLARAGLRITPAVRDVAAYLAVPGAVLAGPSAARTYRIPVPDDGSYLIVPPGCRVRLDGVRYLRGPVGPREVNLFEGMPVCGCGRAVVDCLGVLQEPDAQRLLDRALQQGWLTIEELADTVRRRAGRWGVSRLVRLLRQATDGTRSHAERLLVTALRRAGVRGWVAGHPVAVNGRIVAEVDIAFPGAQLAVEVDGRAFHVTADRFERDRSRQNQLVAAGWTVLRFTWADLTHRPEQVVVAIQSMLARLGA